MLRIIVYRINYTIFTELIVTRVEKSEAKLKSVIGTKIEKWKILGRAPLTSSSKYIRVFAECKCGIIKNIQLQSLLQGRSKSCSKCARTKGPDHHSWKGYEDLSSEFYRRYLHHAASINVPFEISIKDAWNQFIKQNKKCNLTGWKLVILGKNKTASLDRIDSKLGYTKDNIQWIHRDINCIKQSFNHEYFLAICVAVAKYSGKKLSKKIFNKDEVQCKIGFGMQLVGNNNI